MADWLKPKECAARWRVSEDTILNLIHRGKLKAKKIGGRYRIPRVVAEEFEEIGEGRGKPAKRKTEKLTGAAEEAIALYAGK